MKTRPSFINELDWKLLTEKYKRERQLEKVIEKIKNDYPVQYMIGNVEFYNVTIDVNKNVLIPRFETELLVDLLLKDIKKYDLSTGNVLDLCTGSGCIAIALKKSEKGLSLTAVDKNIKSLCVASKNARKNDVEINFKHKDVLKNHNYKNKFSVIVSNPPYVKLEEEVSKNTKFEPKMALYPGENDILFYENILEYAEKILYPKSIIAFEIGSTQADRICHLANKKFPNAKIKVYQDYNKFDRFVFIYNNI